MGSNKYADGTIPFIFYNFSLNFYMKLSTSIEGYDKDRILQSFRVESLAVGLLRMVTLMALTCWECPHQLRQFSKSRMLVLIGRLMAVA